MAATEAASADPCTWTVLFVDDERPVLDGLRRMLRPMRHHWNMEYCSDSRMAAKLVEQGDIDALVTDMRMPLMNGVELLHAVRLHSPRTLRFVLSGHADRGAAIRSVGLAHQFLAKPCEPATLITALCRGQEALRQLGNPGLAVALAGLPALAGHQEAACAITSHVRHEQETLERLSLAVEADVAMTARVLQLVSSSFFGVGRVVSSVGEAVTALGSEVMSVLALSPGALAGEMPSDSASEVSALCRHALRVSRVAARIAALQGCNAASQGTARLGGMLHDTGRLALLGVTPEQKANLPQGHTGHVQLGAGLLALWGLPATITDTVGFQSGPWNADGCALVPAAAVHIADVLVHELDGEPVCMPDFDESGLCATGLRASRQELLDEAAGLLGDA
jgi:HD-like signal output (HDOD) protein/DNA-binding NarL/FixJ family response regulator